VRPRAGVHRKRVAPHEGHPRACGVVRIAFRSDAAQTQRHRQYLRRVDEVLGRPADRDVDVEHVAGRHATHSDDGGHDATKGGDRRHPQRTRPATTDGLRVEYAANRPTRTRPCHRNERESGDSNRRWPQQPSRARPPQPAGHRRDGAEFQPHPSDKPDGSDD